MAIPDFSQLTPYLSKYVPSINCPIQLDEEHAGQELMSPACITEQELCGPQDYFALEVSNAVHVLPFVIACDGSKSMSTQAAAKRILECHAPATKPAFTSV